MSHKCSKCLRTYDLVELYEKHIKDNRCKELYVCEPCNYTTNRKSSYDSHLKSKKCKDVHKKEERKKLYACPHCSKSFIDNYHLSRHLNRKVPCHIVSSIINNNTNTTNSHNNTNTNANNTMMNSNNKTIIINAHDPSAFIKDLDKVDRAIFNNLLQSHSIDSPESIEKMNEIGQYIPYKEPRLVTKETKPRYSEEEIEAYNNDSYQISNNQYLGSLFQRSFFDPNDLECAPFFKIPNTKKITVKYKNELRELDYDIIQQVIDKINHKMILLEKEESVSLYQIKQIIDKEYESIRDHFIHRIRNYKRVSNK